MEKEEWDRMGRQDREGLLISLSVNKGLAERNAKSNFEFLDEGVKRTVGKVIVDPRLQKNIDEIDHLTEGPKRVDKCLPLLLSALRYVSEGIGYQMVSDYIHAVHMTKASEYFNETTKHANKLLLLARRDCPPELEGEISKAIDNVYEGASELTLAQAENHIRKAVPMAIKRYE